MTRSLKALTILVALILVEFPAQPAAAVEWPVATPTSVDLYGASLGFSLEPGDIVTVRTPSGLVCGTCEVSTAGFYGLVHVYGDDPTTPERDGALPGERLELDVNGEPVRPAGAEPVWTRDGDRQRVNVAR